ncbi:hypothetical protein V7S43_009954 [Phytophthora oleae]|uniref:Uncharacterized protein n=1 Tax=Phytophthora oleae TaxID=2107226 RepID=A0ABD3FIG7_9STRA
MQKTKYGSRSLSWKLIAKNQRDARFHAETQQRRFCAAIDMRAALIHGFRTCLNGKRDKELVEELKLSPKEHKRTLELSDTEIFATYANELDVIYAQTDKALHEFQLESSIHDWKEGNKAGSCLYTKVQTIPSNSQETCRFLCQVAFVMHRQENRELFCESKDPENTVVTREELRQFCSTLSLADTKKMNA